MLPDLLSYLLATGFAHKISVIAEMSLLLLFLLVLPLSNRVFSKETDELGQTMHKSERSNEIEGKFEELGQTMHKSERSNEIEGKFEGLGRSPQLRPYHSQAVTGRALGRVRVG